MRGFSQSPHIEKFPERYGVESLAIAVYPMLKEFPGFSALIPPM